MILVVGSFRIPSQQLDEARTTMRRVILASRAEQGCIAYDYAQDILDPGLIRVSEAWTDREALSAHFASPHMQTWREERAKLGMTNRIVTAYAVTNGEEL